MFFTKTKTTYNIFFLLLENGKEILSMNEVLSYLLKSSRPLIDETDLSEIQHYDAGEWQNLVDDIRGMVVTYPGMVCIL